MDGGALSQFASFFDFIVDVFVFLCSLIILACFRVCACRILQIHAVSIHLWFWSGYLAFNPFLAAEMITDGRCTWYVRHELALKLQVPAACCQIGYPTTWLPIEGKRRMRRLFREHRTVVLPDFQGMGNFPCNWKIKRQNTSRIIKTQYGSTVKMARD